MPTFVTVAVERWLFISNHLKVKLLDIYDSLVILRRFSPNQRCFLVLMKCFFLFLIFEKKEDFIFCRKFINRQIKKDNDLKLGIVLHTIKVNGIVEKCYILFINTKSLTIIKPDR